MSNKMTRVLAGVIILSWCNVASAVVIYDEGKGGDAASAVGSPLVGANVGELSFGNNEILGTSTGILGPADFDDYIFMIAFGSAANSISFSPSSFLFGGRSDGFGADLYRDNTLLSAFEITDFGPGTFSAFTVSMPLSAGTYRIDHRQVPEVVDFDYTWEIDVVPDNVVPEPATLVLLGLGFASLGWVTRKKA
jgi:hypothetical protein